jgi:sulfur-oxidizing protein SoxZ
MAKVKPRVRVPKNAKQGEVVEIKTLISHEMETGRRKGKDGNLIPRKIINRFECRFGGEVVFAADWHPAISANPYMAFHYKAEKSGDMEFKWVDDDGTEYTATEKLNVS